MSIMAKDLELEDNELSDEQFDKLLRDKQHRQMLSQMKELVLSLKQDNESDKELAKFIKQHSDNMSLFVSKLSELSKPVSLPAPNVTLNTDNKQLIEAISNVETWCEKIYKCGEETNELLQNLINIRKADVELIPTREWNGSATVIQKVTAKTILNKPKYQA